MENQGHNIDYSIEIKGSNIIIKGSQACARIVTDFSLVKTHSARDTIVEKARMWK